MTRDEKYMKIALQQAQKALASDEVPVGAVIVRDDLIISYGANQTEKDTDPTSHAEIIAIRRAAQAVKDWRLDGCELFCTLEPCAMCAGAIIKSRLRRLIFGAFDPLDGYMGSVMDMSIAPKLAPIEILGGVLVEECSLLLKKYFNSKR